MHVFRIGQHADDWIPEHVVLLGAVDEFMRQPSHDLILRGCDLHDVFPHVRMADKVAADHPFLIEIAAESVTHPAVDPGQSSARANRFAKAPTPLHRELSHRPARRNDVKRAQPIRIGKPVEFRSNLDNGAVRTQRQCEAIDGVRRTMALPSALQKTNLHAVRLFRNAG